MRRENPITGSTWNMLSHFKERQHNRESNRSSYEKWLEDQNKQLLEQIDDLQYRLLTLVMEKDLGEAEDSPIVEWEVPEKYANRAS